MWCSFPPKYLQKLFSDLSPSPVCPPAHKYSSQNLPPGPSPPTREENVCPSRQRDVTGPNFQFFVSVDWAAIESWITRRKVAAYLSTHGNWRLCISQKLCLVLLPKLFCWGFEQQLLLLRKGLEDKKWSLMLVQLQVSGNYLQFLVKAERGAYHYFQNTHQ